MYISDQVNPGVYTVDVAQPAENAKSTLSAVYPVAADGTIAINGINMNINNGGINYESISYRICIRW